MATVSSKNSLQRSFTETLKLESSMKEPLTCSFRQFLSLLKTITKRVGSVALVYTTFVSAAFSLENEAWKSLLCESESPELASVWSLGRFDADIHFSKVYIPPSQSPAKLETYAADLARQKKHRSYKTIACSSEFSWILTSPVPSGMFSKNNKI